MKINQAMSLCFANNIKVYPINVGKTFYIEYSGVGEPVRFKKPLETSKEVVDAMIKTYLFLAKKL